MENSNVEFRQILKTNLHIFFKFKFQNHFFKNCKKMWKMSEMHISIKRNYLKKFQIIFPIFEKIKRRQVQIKFLKNHEKIQNNFPKIVEKCATCRQMKMLISLNFPDFSKNYLIFFFQKRSSIVLSGKFKISKLSIELSISLSKEST